jgi:speckle-type POZ protein
VEIEVCSKVFAAHKSVLAVASSVFMAFFFGPTEEDTSYMRIDDAAAAMRLEAFEALLHYMYLLPEMIVDSPEQAATAVLLATDR